MSRTIYTICWRDLTGHQQAGIYSCVYSSTCAAAPKSKWIRKWPTQTCTQSVVYLACCQHRDEDSLTLEWRRTTTWLWLARLACGGMTTMKGATVCDMYVHAQCIQLHTLWIHTYIFLCSDINVRNSDNYDMEGNIKKGSNPPKKYPDT